MAAARKLTIVLHNHTAADLSSVASSPRSGGLTLPPGPLKKGSTLDVVAQNFGDGCEGSFTFGVPGGLQFEIVYNAPGNKDPATVRVTPAGRAIGEPDGKKYNGAEVRANVGLYDGVPVRANAPVLGHTVPLAVNPYVENYAADMINSLFQANVRADAVVRQDYDQGSAAPYKSADFTGEQMERLVQVMLDQWPTYKPNPSRTPDAPLIAFLADFLSPANTKIMPLTMWVPSFTYQGYVDTKNAKGPKYQLTGYRAHHFRTTKDARFDWDSVKAFLRLFLGGAHFVNIQADKDFNAIKPKILNTGRDLYDSFKKTFPNNNTTGGRHNCIGNSHYAAVVNTGGWYYGNQMGEWASPGAGLLLALLVGRTADFSYNTFMQLEGWPADGDWWDDGSLSGGERHGQDYAAYKNSLWNISSFGAAPYSEKRATTIFLSPGDWVPKICSDTYMMPYVGAGSKQKWLKTELVSVPAGTPKKPY